LRRNQPVLATLRRHSQKLIAKLQNAKAEADEIRDEWSVWIERIEGDKFSTLDSEAKKHFYLRLIESFYEQNQDLREMISIKNEVNNNQGKIKVVNSLLSKSSKQGSPSEVAQQSYMNESALFDTVEDKIREAEEENNRLNIEIRNANSKIANLEKEIKRCKACFEGRDIDAEIKAAENKIRELEEQL
jgi:hypothetical protein